MKCSSCEKPGMVSKWLLVWKWSRDGLLLKWGDIQQYFPRKSLLWPADQFMKCVQRNETTLIYWLILCISKTFFLCYYQLSFVHPPIPPIFSSYASIVYVLVPVTLPVCFHIAVAIFMFMLHSIKMECSQTFRWFLRRFSVINLYFHSDIIRSEKSCCIGFVTIKRTVIHHIVILFILL